MTRIIAHRGSPETAPENTLAAFLRALEEGAEGIEFDVQAGRDGIPVVIHDELLERTTDGKGPVGARSAAELGGLDAGSWFGPAFAGEGLPTLAAVLEVLAPAGVDIHLELKTARVPYPGLVGAVAAAVNAAGAAGRCVLSSFNHYTLREAAQAAPHLPRAALLMGRMIDPWAYAQQHGFQALHPEYTAVDEDYLHSAHAAGLAVRPYIVNDPEAATRLIAWGVDGIITNRPANMLRLRGPA